MIWYTEYTNTFDIEYTNKEIDTRDSHTAKEKFSFIIHRTYRNRNINNMHYITYITYSRLRIRILWVFIFVHDVLCIYLQDSRTYLRRLRSSSLFTLEI